MTIIRDIAHPTGQDVVFEGRAVDMEITANTAPGTTQGMNKSGLAMGSFRVPNGSNITSIEWYMGYSASDTPVVAKDEDGVAITQTVAADEGHQVKSALSGFKYVYPVTDAEGTLYFHWER